MYLDLVAVAVHVHLHLLLLRLVELDAGSRRRGRSTAVGRCGDLAGVELLLLDLLLLELLRSGWPPCRRIIHGTALTDRHRRRFSNAGHAQLLLRNASHRLLLLLLPSGAGTSTER